MQEDIFVPDAEADTSDHEKSSYGAYAYKRVQRLRRKGKRRGIDVPPLGYDLTEPEKPRIVFWVIAIVSAVLFVGMLVGLILLYNVLIKTFSDLRGIGDFLKIVFKPAVLTASFGWSAIPGILLVAVYLLLAVLFALPIVAVVYFYRFVRDAFYMTKCSKEEFARGSIVSSRLTGLAVVLATATVLFIVLLSYISAASAKLYFGLIYGGLVLALGGLLACMAVEKVRCGKWFEGLGEDKKQNYLAHERALRKVKSRLRTEKQLWNDWGN